MQKVITPDNKTPNTLFNTLKKYLLFVTVNEFSFLILNYFVLLTIFTEVIHNNNST